MSRPFRVRALALAALAAAGCQDYNFNPVGKCVLQPGTQRVRLSDLSTADILFVVDESGSMQGEQQKLAANFDAFIQNLDAYNTQRVARQLEPVDFHVAVTTTSIYFNESRNDSHCRNDCTGAVGQNVCCQSSGQPLREPKRCDPAASTCGAGTTCRADCIGLNGENFCCDATGSAPVTEVISCSAVGARCGTLQTHYDFQGCNAGVGVDGWPWAQGDFVSWTSGAAANPRVLHFDKELYTGAGVNRQGFDSDELKAFFVGGTVGSTAVQGNVIVGTCGSGQEQALQAARLALEKAGSGSGQRDTYDLAGNLQWTPATRQAGANAEWPHRDAKLVLVFVGDEDDCSSPADSGGGVVWLPLAPNQDTCVDPSKGETGKQFPITGMVDYFFSLNRPLGAAFIFPASQETCSGTTCSAGSLCCSRDCPGSVGVCTSNSTCGAQSPGFRLLEAANEFRTRGADVVTGSICDPNFGDILSSIADIVKPPTGLVLPTLPAASAVTVLRITDRAGLTRKTCRGPAPANLTETQAKDAGYDWWFTATRGAIPADSSGTSLFVHINNETGNCAANPGETYSADYLGRLPADGCTPDPNDRGPLNDPATGRDQCQDALGGLLDNWACYAAPGDAVGTCVCCTPGSTTPECQ